MNKRITDTLELVNEVLDDIKPFGAKELKKVKKVKKVLHNVCGELEHMAESDEDQIPEGKLQVIYDALDTVEESLSIIQGMWENIGWEGRLSDAHTGVVNALREVRELMEDQAA